MDLTLILYQALRSRIGLIIETNNRDTLRARLYTARREAMDPDLDVISAVMDPIHTNRLWLVKRKVSDAPS